MSYQVTSNTTTMANAPMLQQRASVTIGEVTTDPLWGCADGRIADSGFRKPNQIRRDNHSVRLTSLGNGLKVQSITQIVKYSQY